MHRQDLAVGGEQHQQDPAGAGHDGGVVHGGPVARARDGEIDDLGIVELFVEEREDRGRIDVDRVAGERRTLRLAFAAGQRLTVARSREKHSAPAPKTDAATASANS